MGQCLNVTFYSRQKMFPNQKAKMTRSPVKSDYQYLFVFLVKLVILSVLQTQCCGHMIGHNPHHRTETLDPLGRYQLEWLVEFDEKRVTFNVTVQTKGYVGFGLSRNGTMSDKADIVIGGVTSSGKSYFTDRYAVGNQLPEVDANQDWTLNDAWESGTHTFLSFSRRLDTCDEDDYPITNDKMSLIWAIGETDTEIGHRQHRGSYDVYLLDPDYSPKIIRDVVQDTPKVIGRESSEMKLWTISKKSQLAPNQTSYMCTIHKGPRLLEKHHLVGFDVHFTSPEETERYVHNVNVYKCNPPRGSNARSMFDPFAGDTGKGQSCFLLNRPQGPMPTNYCTELFHGWGIGGKEYFTPNEVGYPFGLSADEYYMVQAHYENPDKLNEIGVEYELEFYYTSKVRSHDAGVMVIGHEIPGVPPSLMIPANSSGHMIFGHCGSECTKLMFPTSGIRIFAVGLHSHNSGRQLRLQQFRNTREMTWISSDNNYNPFHKQIRNLREHVRVLPGDHLVIRCSYDNTWTQGTVVGGFSASNEQCLAYMHYYNKINDFTNCKSEIISDDYRQRFLGVTNVTWDDSQNEYVVDPASSLFESAYLGGLALTSVSDNHVSWEPEIRAEFERFHRYHPQINTCSKELYAREDISAGRDVTSARRIVRSGGSRDEYSGATAYPFSAKEYQPEKSCSLLIS